MTSSTWDFLYPAHFPVFGSTKTFTNDYPTGIPNQITIGCCNMLQVILTHNILSVLITDSYAPCSRLVIKYSGVPAVQVIIYLHPQIYSIGQEIKTANQNN